METRLTPPGNIATDLYLPPVARSNPTRSTSDQISEIRRRTVFAFLAANPPHNLHCEWASYRTQGPFNPSDDTAARALRRRVRTLFGVLLSLGFVGDSIFGEV
ncbi:hypothetical protein ACLB2K_007279 [Fragaria x ananassa]